MTISIYDAAYALLTAGAAMLWPPLALLTAGAFLVATAIVNDRRTEVKA